MVQVATPDATRNKDRSTGVGEGLEKSGERKRLHPARLPVKEIFLYSINLCGNSSSTRPESLPPPDWRRKMPAIMAPHQATIYTRAGCHLCEEAEQLLVRHGLRPDLIDIDADAVLRDRYNDCVPVVLIDGKERFRGRVNEVLLRRILAERGG